MSTHDQATKEASEVLRSFNIIGSQQNEPQNLSTSVATSQMLPTGPPPGQWHVHSQPHQLMYPHGNNPTPNEETNSNQNQTEATNGNAERNTSQNQNNNQSLDHMSVEQIAQQLPQGPIEHSIWSTSDMDSNNYNMGEMAANDNEEEEVNGVQEYEEEEETKPKIKKEIKKKRKLADLLAEGIDPTKLEENSEQVRDRFMKGCECEGDNCFKNMNPEFVFRHRLNIAELTKNEHDMYLMGVTMACLANPEETSRHKERKRLRASYVFQGKKVCLDAFLYLENCTHYQLKAIRKHVMVNGVTPRVHGNHGKKPPNTFPLDTYQHAAAFLQSYIARYSPHSATPKKTNKSGKAPPVYLPADITRKKIHNAYKEYCEHFEPDVKVMGYSSFRHFMKEQFPNVKFFRMDKKLERMPGQSDDDEEEEDNLKISDSRQQTEPEPQRNDRLQNNPLQLSNQQNSRDSTKDARNTPPVTTAPQSTVPTNAHNGAPTSMPHPPIGTNYQPYSHSGLQLPLNLQTQQPLYSACMQPGMFPPGQAPPQVRPSGFPYTNL